jgi:outer membrane protein W
MNHRKLTQRNLEIYIRRSKIHIFLLVLFISLLAGTGRAQVTDRSKERTDKQGKEKDRRRPTLDLAKIARTSEGEEGPTEVFAAASATSASSQAASDLSKFAVFGNVGVTVPHGDFSTFADPGFSFNTGLEYMLTSQFSAEGILGFHRFRQFPGFFGDHTNLYQVSANGKYYFVKESSKVRPFVNGGVGVYVTDFATAHFGGNVGGGVLYEATPHFGIQGSYNLHIVSSGSNVHYSTVQGGVRFRF